MATACRTCSVAGIDGIVTLTWPQVRALMTSRVITVQAIGYALPEPGRSTVLARAETTLALIQSLHPDSAELEVQALEGIADSWRKAAASPPKTATPAPKPKAPAATTAAPPVGGAASPLPVAPVAPAGAPSRKSLYLALGALALGAFIVGARR